MAALGLRSSSTTQWQGIYDYLCATATHPTLSAFEFFDVTASGQPFGSMSAGFAGRLLRSGTVAFSDALRHMAGYCGWDDAPVNDFIDEIERVL